MLLKVDFFNFSVVWGQFLGKMGQNRGKRAELTKISQISVNATPRCAIWGITCQCSSKLIFWLFWGHLWGKNRGKFGEITKATPTPVKSSPRHAVWDSIRLYCWKLIFRRFGGNLWVKWAQNRGKMAELNKISPHPWLPHRDALFEVLFANVAQSWYFGCFGGNLGVK